MKDKMLFSSTNFDGHHDGYRYYKKQLPLQSLNT